MRRMFSENQLIELIKKYGGDIDKIKEELLGSFVRIMDAPKSTTLTDEQIAQIREGVFINGNFLGYHNPILIPAQPVGVLDGYYGGLLIGTTEYPQQGPVIKGFSINTSKVIAASTNEISFNVGYSGRITIKGLYSLNDKLFPNYPSNDNIGHLICRKGTLQWYIPVAQDNITSGDVVALDSALGKALIDHLEVDINGHRCKYEYTSGNYVVYSSMAEVESGAKLQVNMIRYNTTDESLSFNQMTFTPDN